MNAQERSFRRAETLLSSSLDRAFPIPATGSFDDLLRAIDVAEQNSFSNAMLDQEQAFVGAKPPVGIT
jgi:hypothetical protein